MVTTETSQTLNKTMITPRRIKLAVRRMPVDYVHPCGVEMSNYWACVDYVTNRAIVVDKSLQGLVDLFVDSGLSHNVHIRMPQYWVSDAMGAPQSQFQVH